MKSLRFKQLLVISHSSQRAGMFLFHDRLNLIVGSDNTIGKSTLAKLPLWTLGCEPTLDANWASLDCQCVLDFVVRGVGYRATRHKNIITIVDSEGSVLYPKITGEYSEWFAQLVGFSAKLPDRNTAKPETPPPAYYFVPFYIDQRKSWAHAWENFSGLAQYANWKATIMKAHIGLLDETHFKLEENKFAKSAQRKVEDATIQRYRTANEVVTKFIPETYLAIQEKELDQIAESVRVELFDLSKKQEILLDTLARHEDDLAYAMHQIRMTDVILEDANKDYEYATHAIETEDLECPLCGTLHSNSLVNRASILVDRDQAISQKGELEKVRQRAEAAIAKSQTELTVLRATMESMNRKYISGVGAAQLTFSNVVEGLAGQSIRRQVEEAQGKSEVTLRGLENELKAIGLAQKNNAKAKDKSTIESDFMRTWLSYMERLGATSVNTSEIKSILDYNKVVNSGGAAEGVRGILAYYLAVYKMISIHSNEAIAPLVVDTPNQQEQSLKNYAKILDLLDLVTAEAIQGAQLFICAMDTEQVAPHKAKGKVFTMTKSKVLNAEDYEDVKALIG